LISIRELLEQEKQNTTMNSAVSVFRDGAAAASYNQRMANRTTTDLEADTRKLEQDREERKKAREAEKKEAERKAAEEKKKTSEDRAKQDSAATLLEAFKKSWGVTTDYAKAGTLNAEKVKQSDENKVDLIGATKSLVKGAVKSSGASVSNAGTTVLRALDT